MKRGWRRAFRVGSVERDVAEELAFHRERTVEDLVAAGATRADAEAEADRRFGDAARWRRELERVDRGVVAGRRLGGLARAAGDVARTAARGVARNPGVAAAIALVFALGVGANAVMFGMVDRVLLSPPPGIAEPTEVRRLMVDRFETYRNREAVTDRWTYSDFVALQDVATLESVAAYAERDVVVGRGPTATEIPAVLVTGAFFSTLGVAPAAGRFFTPEEDVRGGPRVAVLGHGYWQRVHGGDPAVVGSALELADGTYTVVGVTPRGFTGVELRRADIWLPLHVSAFPGYDGWMANPAWYWMRVVGRLASGTTVARAEAEATGAHRSARRESMDAGDYDPDARILAGPLIAAQGPLASTESTIMKWLAGVSLLVLLIAASNVANLLLARTAERRREVAVRLALGVSHRRLASEMMAEAVLLALLGAGAALALALFGGAALQRALLPDVAWGDPLTARLVLFTAGVALVAGLAAMILPAVQAIRGDVGDALRGGRGSIGAGGRLRTVLTAAQAALSVILLAGAGLFVRSLDRAHGMDLGLDAESLVVVDPVGLPDLPVTEEARLMADAEARAEGIPGVESATLVGWSRPFGGTIFTDLRVPGRDSLPELAGRTPAASLVGPDYLGTMGLRLVAGRWIRDDDVVGTAPVVVVNRAMADLLFDGDAISRCFHVEDGPCATVIGMVATAKQSSPLEDPRPQFYLPAAQHPDRQGSQVAYLRLTGGADAPIAAVRNAFLQAIPDARYIQIERAPDLIAPYVRPWRLGATLFSAFGVLALLVAALGLYSLLAYDVVRRTPELGVRAALGASRRRLVRSVITRSLRVVTAGLAVGLATTWLLAPRVEELLFETSARDAATFLAVIATLLAASIAAAGLPAARASRVDPNVALRAE